MDSTIFNMQECVRLIFCLIVIIGKNLKKIIENKKDSAIVLPCFVTKIIKINSFFNNFLNVSVFFYIYI